MCFLVGCGGSSSAHHGFSDGGDGGDGDDDSAIKACTISDQIQTRK